MADDKRKGGDRKITGGWEKKSIDLGSGNGEFIITNTVPRETKPKEKKGKGNGD